jgi:hypothetical protein
MKAKDLKVTSVRYFETRNGLGYECQTNHPDVKIWNDGNGGDTYVAPSEAAREMGAYELREADLQNLINEYEGVEPYPVDGTEEEKLAYLKRVQRQLYS